MSLLRCSVCGIQKEDDGKSTLCPMCGGAFLRATDDVPEEATVQQQEELDSLFIPEIERAKLFQLVRPAIENDSKIWTVRRDIEKYLQERTKHYSRNVFSVLWDIYNNYAKAAEEKRESVQAARAAVLGKAIQEYKATRDMPSSGLGFSIITNSAVSAAAYVGLAAYEEKKHRLKQELAAAEKFNKELRALSAIASEASNILVEGIDSLVYIFEHIHNAYTFVEEHKDFYANPAQYDVGISVGGVNIYQLLSDIANSDFLAAGVCQPRMLKGNAQDLAWILPQLDGAGYIKYMPTITSSDYASMKEQKCYYVTTGKYERTVLQNKYWAAHPEEKQAADKAVAEENAKQYALAVELLNRGKYYDAAVSFAKLDGYQDSMQRSIHIWKERILPQNTGTLSPGKFAVTTTGSVVLSKSFPYPDARNQWEQLKNIKQLRDLGYGRFVAVDFSGQLIYSMDTKLITKYNALKWRMQNVIYISKGYMDCIAFLYEDGTVDFWGQLDGKEISLAHWNNISKIFLQSDVIIGLKKDGTMIAEGKITALSHEYHKWRDIADIKYFNSEYLIALTADGRVLAAGGDYDNYNAISGWTHIVDVFPSYKVPVGITSAGAMLWGSKSTNKGRVSVSPLFGLRGVVAISEHFGHIVALKADGTVCAYVNQVPKDLSKWENVAAVGTDLYCEYAIQADGTILIAEKNSEEGQKTKESEGWKLFDHIDTAQEKQNQMIRNILQLQLDEQKAKLQKLWGPFSNKKRQNILSVISNLERRIDELK